LRSKWFEFLSRHAGFGDRSGHENGTERRRPGRGAHAAARRGLHGRRSGRSTSQRAFGVSKKSRYADLSFVPDIFVQATESRHNQENPMRIVTIMALLALSGFLSDQACGQTGYTGTATVVGSNILTPGTSYSCNVVDLGNGTILIWINGVYMNAVGCTLDFYGSPPWGVFIECPPYWGDFDLTLTRI
jgi:hypothetical protein